MQNDTINVKVSQKTLLGTNIMGFTLVPMAGGALPAWQPGAHVQLNLSMPDEQGMPAILQRQYSLCGDCDNESAWQIAVLGDESGRGGSVYIHQELQVGDEISVSLPRNHFAFTPSPKCLFIAGGIGITPLLPMVRQAQAQGLDWQLVYLTRQPAQRIYAAELQAYGDRVLWHSSDDQGHWDVAAALAQCDADTSVYSCGPQGLLEALEQASQVPGTPWHLFVERFAVTVGEDIHAGKAFELVLQKSGRRLHVPAGESILSVLKSAGVKVNSSCRSGTCGACETVVISGLPDHRDVILSAEERADNETMMICVSRALSSELVLDL